MELELEEKNTYMEQLELEIQDLREKLKDHHVTSTTTMENPSPIIKKTMFNQNSPQCDFICSVSKQQKQFDSTSGETMKPPKGIPTYSPTVNRLRRKLLGDTSVDNTEE